jgi:hypothetical protein
MNTRRTTEAAMTQRHSTALKNALTTVLATTTVVASTGAFAEPLPAPGALLRQGEWGGSVGTFLVPAPFEGTSATQWPMDGWVVLLDAQAATLTIRPLAAAEARERFKPITEQVARAETQAQEGELQQTPDDVAADLYVRVPGATWKAGSVPIHRFKNGSTTLLPELGYRFQMKLNDKPYAFTVQNGFRTEDGRPYGEGVQFSLEIDGERFDYDLGGFGWDVRLNALGDVDGDGKPDFLFGIGGNNSGNEALVLSTLAKPGRNPPTAYLTSVGC